jgi:transposase-like protein
MSVEINQRPIDCPNCNASLTQDYEEYDGDRHYICWLCPNCGTHVVDCYSYSSSEVYTKDEWDQ